MSKRKLHVYILMVHCPKRNHAIVDSVYLTSEDASVALGNLCNKNPGLYRNAWFIRKTVRAGEEGKIISGLKTKSFFIHL